MGDAGLELLACPLPPGPPAWGRSDSVGSGGPAAAQRHWRSSGGGGALVSGPGGPRLSVGGSGGAAARAVGGEGVGRRCGGDCDERRRAWLGSGLAGAPWKGLASPLRWAVRRELHCSDFVVSAATAGSLTWHRCGRRRSRRRRRRRLGLCGCGGAGGGRRRSGREPHAPQSHLHTGGATGRGAEACRSATDTSECLRACD